LEAIAMHRFLSGTAPYPHYGGDTMVRCPKCRGEAELIKSWVLGPKRRPGRITMGLWRCKVCRVYFRRAVK